MTAGLVVLLVLAFLVLLVVGRTIRIIPQARASVVERLGRFNRTLEPGLAVVIPFVDRVRPLIDLREQVVSFPPQPVITEDNLVVQIDSVIYFQVTDPKAATYEIANYIQAIEQLTVTTLRNVIGGMTLEKTLTSRDQINTQLRGVLDEATGKWGIRVNRVELKAIDPPASIQETMEKQMRAERDRRAAILQAEGIKQSQILTAEGEKQSAILQAEGQREAQAAVRGGAVQGDRDRVRRHPRGRRRPEAARLPVPPDAAADRAGRRQQGVDHPERDHAGAREPRRRRGQRARSGCQRRSRWPSSRAEGLQQASHRPAPTRRCPEGRGPVRRSNRPLASSVMFDTLSERLQAALGDVRSRGKLTEDDVNKAMRAIRLALLEADVNFQVVKQFTAAVKERALADVLESLNPGQQVVKLVDEELTTLMGGSGATSCSRASRPP